MSSTFQNKDDAYMWSTIDFMWVFHQGVLHILRKSVVYVILKSRFLLISQLPTTCHILWPLLQIWKFVLGSTWISKILQCIKSWDWFSTFWFLNVLFFFPSNLFFGFEPISWQIFSISDLFFSLICTSCYYLFFAAMWFNDYYVPQWQWSSICTHPKFVVRALLRDDFTKVHPSSFGMRLQFSMRVGICSFKYPIDMCGIGLEKVIEA